MAKKKVQLNINAEDLKKKLNIKDGYSPIKGVDYFDGEKGDRGEDGITPDTTEVAIEASKIAQVELESKIPTISQIISELPSFGAEVRDSLELLQGEDRLDKSAIRGLDDYDEVAKLARQPKKEIKKYYNSTTPGLQNPVDYIQFNTSATPITETPGLAQWNLTEDTLDLVTQHNTYQLGQELSPLYKNQTGSTIPNACPVMSNGSLGASGRIKMVKAIADGTYDPSTFLGLTTEYVANGDDGKATWFGKVRNIDTTGTPYGETWADGDKLYVSGTTAGYLTNVKPNAPKYQIFVGEVVNAHAINGTIFVKPSWNPKLEDLSNVNGTPLTTTGQFPTWHEPDNYFDFDKNIIKKNFINTSVVEPTFSYTSGNLTGISYSDTTSKAITYNGDGTIHTLTVTFPDTSTVTKTFNWSSGVLTSVTIV